MNDKSLNIGNAYLKYVAAMEHHFYSMSHLLVSGSLKFNVH